MAGVKSRELADLTSVLRRELGDDAIESLEAGEEVSTVLRELGRDHPGLETLALRLQGLKGKEEE